MRKAIIPLFIFVLVVFGIVFYVSRFGVVANIGMKSIALSNSVMLKNLTNGKDEEVIKYENVNANETLYRFGSKYYVGENKRRYVADDFPIMSEDGSVLLIVNELGNYIDESFVKTKAYKDNIIVDSHLYNAVNNEQIDNLEYLFLEMNNGIFVNVSKLTINVNKEDKVIPTNSYIYFSKNSLCYYYLKDSKFIYDEIPVIDDNERVNIGKYNISYNELMVYLGIRKDKKIIEDIKVEEEVEIEEEEEEEEQVEEEKDNRVLLDVKVNDVKANIYSISGNISIIDLEGAIIKNPTIELKKDGKLYLRKTVEDGDFLLSGLSSDSEYEMKVSYIYVKDRKRYEKVIYNEIVKTKSKDNLESIKLNIDNIETTTDNVIFNNIKLLNNMDDEVLRGIKSVVVKIGNNNITLDVKRRNDLLKLETINFETEHMFKSNSEYDVEFKFIDVDDQEVSVENNKYNIITKKSAPVGSIDVRLDKNFKRVGINFKVNNADEVNIDNYTYNVYDEFNNIVSTGKFVDSKYFVEIDNLNNASKYTVKLFTTYFESDGSKVDNLEIASADFITYDFKKLGEISFSIKENIEEGKETSITSNSGSFIINYTNYNNEDVIYSLINYDVKVQVVNVKTLEVEKEITVDKYDFVGNGVVVDFDELKSNTEYSIEIKPVIVSNNEVYEVKTAYLNNKFKTFKQDASFNVMNLYIASGYIDFDAVIYDKDKTILQDDSSLNVYDENNKLVHTQLLKNSSTLSNGDSYNLNHVNLSKLDADKKYTFKVVATDYDNGYKKQDNKVIDSIREYTLSGTNGKLLIDKIIDSAYHKYETGEDTAQNLFDINNEARWKTTTPDQNTYALKQVKNESNSIELSAKNGIASFYYYVPELIGKKVTVSFKMKLNTSDGENNRYIEVLNNSNSATGSNKVRIDNISLDYREERYVATFKSLGNNGYLVFNIFEVNGENNTTKVEIKDLMITEGTSTEYKAFNSTNTYASLFGINLEDPKENDMPLANYVNSESSDTINGGRYLYYLRSKCVGDNCLEEYTKQLIYEDELPMFNSKKELTVNGNCSYTIYLSVYDSLIDRFYDLDSFEFVSDAETRTISNRSEFLGMHPTGNYIVINDLDFKNQTTQYRTFNGRIDFQGHSVYAGNGITPASGALFYTLGGNSVIKNLDFHVDFRSSDNRAIKDLYGVFRDFYGTITNIKVTLEGTNDNSNTIYSMLGYQNLGLIENFVLYTKGELIGSRTLAMGVVLNYGIMKNGYAYGKGINAKYVNDSSGDRSVGIFASYASNSTIKNVYSLADIRLDEIGKELATCGNNCNNKSVGNLVGSINNSSISNCYSHSEIIDSIRDKTKDPSFYFGSNVNYKDIYFSSNDDYVELYSKRIIETSYKNMDFQNQVLNSDNMFLVEDAWKSNIFPHLKWPDCMPEQDYITLPATFSVKDLKVLNVDKVENLSDNSERYSKEIEEGFKHKVTLSIYNPDNVYINSMNIDGFKPEDVRVLPQGANIDVNTHIGIYEILIKDPQYFRSDYILKSINVSKGSSVVDVTFNGVKLKIDLFKEISNLNEIIDTLKVSGNKTINFKLMNDIDYNEIGKVTRIDNKIEGIIDGNNHTIKNINTKACLIMSINGGTLRNLKVENSNIVADQTDRQGFVCTISNSALIDNVSINGEYLDAQNNTVNGNANIGGLVGYSLNSEIRNSSVTNLKIRNVQESRNANIGGLSGTSQNVTYKNCYVRKLDINLTNSLGSVGGAVGYTNAGNMTNVFTTGRIETESNNVGGLIGRTASSTVSSVVSKVDIIARDYLGGIIGNTNNIVSNALSLGNLTTKQSDSLTFHRVLGNNFDGGINYAWDNQLINSYITRDNNGEVLLSTSDLSNPLTYSSKIGLSDNFILDDNFKKGYMPLLYMTNKEKMYVADDDFSDMEIAHNEPFKYLDSEFTYIYDSGYENNKYFANKVYVNNLRFDNFGNHIINSITIDGLDIDRSTFIAKTVNGITSVSFEASPNKYLDSYIISSINYDNNDEYLPAVKLDIQFFGKIASVSDWNNIKSGSAENYIVLNDLSFNGLSNINNNIIFNRLIGFSTNGDKVTISNIGSANNYYVLSDGKGFIDNVLSEIKNLRFSNIYLTNNQKQNSTYSYLSLFKGLNGYMSNVDFSNIYITNTAKNGDYTAIIANNQSPDIRSINLDNINVVGKKYTGGFIANSTIADKTDIFLKNITVSGTDYVGGFQGAESSDENRVHNFNIEAHNITATGTGNYTGGIFGWGSGNNISIYNSTINGKNRVGAIGGRYSSSSVKYLYVFDCYVGGTSDAIGGVYGENPHMYYFYVQRTTVDGKGTANNVGGAAGYGGLQLYYGGVLDSHVINGNTYVGGIRGTCSYCAVNFNYVKDTEVVGKENVGGLVGRTVSTANWIQNNIVKADVKATVKSAGGVIGYITNMTTSTANNITYITQVINANSTVEAPMYAGGLIGTIENNLFAGHFNNDVISSSVTCSSSNCDSGFVVGYNITSKKADDGIENFKNWKIYDGSILNGVKVNSLNSSDKSKFLSTGGQIVDRNYLTNINNFRNLGFNTTNWESVAGYYPRNNNVQTQYKVNFELPNDNTFSTNSNNLLSTSMLRTTSVNNLFTIPEYSVYSSDVDKINITFNNIDGYKNLSFKINDGEYINVDKKTYTMYYDYKEDIILHVKNGLNESVKVYTSEELVNSSSIVNDKFYHLSGSVIESNDEIKADNLSYKNDMYNIRLLGRTNIINNAVNVYNNKILLDNKNIYNIDTKEIEDNDFNNFEIVEDKALYEYDYNDSKIRTYNDYSIINGKIVNKIVLANNKLEIINQSISNNAKNILSNSYNGYDYLLYLENGSLVSIKDKINYPKGFKNYNITSINSKDNIIMVNYKGNDYVVFNYVTGEVIDEKKDYKPSIEEFIGDYFNGSQSNNKINMISDNYKEAKNIVSKLNAKSIDEVLNTDEDKSYVQKSNYSIVYNNLSNEYEIFEIPKEDNTLLVNNIISDNNVSDTINNNSVLFDYYVGKKNGVNVVSSIIIIAPIIGSIFIVVIILRRYFIVNKRVEN